MWKRLGSARALKVCSMAGFNMPLLAYTCQGIFEAKRQRGWGCYLPGEACLAWVVFYEFGIGRKRRLAAALHGSLLGLRDVGGGSFCVAGVCGYMVAIFVA